MELIIFMCFGLVMLAIFIGVVLMFVYGTSTRKESYDEYVTRKRKP